LGVEVSLRVVSYWREIIRIEKGCAIGNGVREGERE
jgi:hypothetical protein